MTGFDWLISVFGFLFACLAAVLLFLPGEGDISDFWDEGQE